jgi:hypothetical protein
MLYIAESAYWCRGSHHYVYKQIKYTSEFAIMGVLKRTCQLDGHGGTILTRYYYIDHQRGSLPTGHLYKYPMPQGHDKHIMT